MKCSRDPSVSSQELSLHAREGVGKTTPVQRCWGVMLFQLEAVVGGAPRVRFLSPVFSRASALAPRNLTSVNLTSFLQNGNNRRAHLIGCLP